MIVKKMLRPLSLLALALSLAACGASSDHSASGSASTVDTNSSTVDSGSTTISLAQSSYTISQSAGSVIVEVARSNATPGAVGVSYATTDGTAIGGTDYTVATGTLNWAADDTSNQQITIAVSNAAPFVGARSFTLVLSTPAGTATLGSPASATITIEGSGTASGSPGSVALSASTYSVAQSTGTVTVTAVRAGGSTGAISIAYATANGTAVSGADYSADGGTLSWADGDTQAKTFSIAISTATPFSGSRSFDVALSAPTGTATLGSPATATITIEGSGTASGSAGSVALSASTYSIAQSTGTLTVTAVRTGGSTGAISAAYATANGTAVSGADYSAASGTLSWANGDTQAKTFTIAISTTTPFTGSRAFKIALSSASGGSTLGTPTTATATITGSGAAGSVELSASSYAISQSAGTLAVTATRTGGSAGAVAVTYATADGTAKAGTDYSATNGTLSWATGDTATKTFTIAISKASSFSGSRNFTITLSSPSGGATLGSPSQASATITGSGAAGSLQLSTKSYSATQAAGSLTVSVMRANGSTGAVSVGYATSNGSAAAGTDYTATSGKLSWADGDASAKTFTVAINNAVPFTGTRNFNIALSGISGGATLGTPSTATTTITGSAAASTGTCAQTSNSWTDSSQGGNIFDWKQYGNYLVNVDNWGNLPGQVTWANSAACWGVTASASNTDIGQVRTYPHVTRGWAESSSMTSLSSPGTNDWTTQAGLGIGVTQLTKARMHWAFQAPLSNACSPYCRWDALADIYFHQTANPAPSEWPPYIDLQVIPALADQVINNTTFYAMVAANDYATTVTIGGNAYMVFIDDSGGASFHQAGGHTIAIFNLPTAFTSNNANPNWGVQESVTDLAAVIKYFMQSNPVDDAGKPLKTAAGTTVTKPLIPSNVYLTAINAGWEIDVGALYTSTAFCVAMQDEADCQ